MNQCISIFRECDVATTKKPVRPAKRAGAGLETPSFESDGDLGGLSLGRRCQYFSLRSLSTCRALKYFRSGRLLSEIDARTSENRAQVRGEPRRPNRMHAGREMQRRPENSRGIDRVRPLQIYYFRTCGQSGRPRMINRERASLVARERERKEERFRYFVFSRD